MDFLFFFKCTNIFLDYNLTVKVPLQAVIAVTNTRGQQCDIKLNMSHNTIIRRRRRRRTNRKMKEAADGDIS